LISHISRRVSAVNTVVIVGRAVQYISTQTLNNDSGDDLPLTQREMTHLLLITMAATMTRKLPWCSAAAVDSPG